MGQRTVIKFWWRSGSPSRYRDCFPDSSLLGDTESGINRLRCATLQCTACTSRRRHSNYEVTTSLDHDRQPVTTDAPWRRYALSQAAALFDTLSGSYFRSSSNLIDCFLTLLRTLWKIIHHFSSNPSENQPASRIRRKHHDVRSNGGM